MSQMKPYCFKCGAELDPDAIYCPECGRLQRSMVVRAVEPGAPSAPPAPHPGSPQQQPYPFYPDREAPAAPERGEPHADQSYHYPDAARQYPDQQDPYAQQPYSEHGWDGTEPAEQGQGHDQWAAQADPAAYQDHQGDHVYAREEYQQDYQDQGDAGLQQQPYGETSWADYQQPQQYGTEQPQQYGTEYDNAAYGGQDHGGYGQPAPAEYNATAQHPESEPDGWRHEPAAGTEPWHAQPDPYSAPEPAPYTRRDPAYHEPMPSAPPAEPEYEPPPPPVYSSAAPVPAGSTYPTYPPPSAPAYGPPLSASRYGRPPGSNPYAPTTYDSGGYGDQPAATSSPFRIVALAAAVLLGLFLVGFGIGHLLGVGSSPSSPAATAQRPGAPTVAPTTQPTSTPLSTPSAAATPTAGQGITGNAKFQKTGASIPGTCSTAQGCPIQVSAKNTGDSGSGSVSVTLSDGGGNQIATFTGPVPVTDAGATVTVNGYATGDGLGAYLRSGGTVYITNVTFTGGG
jgi:hypothetical protein